MSLFDNVRNKVARNADATVVRHLLQHVLLNLFQPIAIVCLHETCRCHHELHHVVLCCLLMPSLVCSAQDSEFGSQLSKPFDFFVASIHSFISCSDSSSSQSCIRCAIAALSEVLFIFPELLAVDGGCWAFVTFQSRSWSSFHPVVVLLFR